MSVVLHDADVTGTMSHIESKDKLVYCRVCGAFVCLCLCCVCVCVCVSVCVWVGVCGWVSVCCECVFRYVA